MRGEERIIRLCYRKIIDNSSTSTWEKYVFDDSYTEFMMQFQFYNQKKEYTTFSQVITKVPGSEKLHFLVSTAIVGYIKQLNGIVPDVLNNSGKHFLPFKNFRFEIINSDVTDRSRHKVAVNFFSDPLIWHDTIGSQLLVSTGDKKDEEEILTEMFSIQPLLSIYSIR